MIPNKISKIIEASPSPMPILPMLSSLEYKPKNKATTEKIKPMKGIKPTMPQAKEREAIKVVD